MRTYFHGWRRKLGVLTLVLACVFVGAWLRSISKFDVVFVNVPHFTLGVISGRSQFTFARANGPLAILQGPPKYFTLSDRCETSILIVERDRLASKERILEWNSISAPDVMHLMNPVTRKSVKVGFTPYWWVVVSLTMLSAGLLLSKPRNSAEST